MTDSSILADASGVVPRHARMTTILLVGRLSSGNRDDLCRVRNISSGGMRIETLAPVDIGQWIDVELKNGMKMRSEVVWRGPSEAGVRFDEPVNIERLLAPPPRLSRANGPRATRSPRLSARCSVALRHDGHILAGVLTDVSQGGGQLAIKGAIKVGDQIVLFIPGLGSHRATIHWARDDSIGISFTEKLGFADLAQWLAGPDRFVPALAPPAS